eukprot:GHUV01028830.1.p1 GENE.GHUV01028830.1~~GHUV01028830.1.p1  ORF type:complete len:173 (+),score=28.18 GHUV01028830.1:586-1104(+)
MKTKQKAGTSSPDTSVSSGGLIAVVRDIEAGKDEAVQFPLAPVGQKQDSVTQSHVGKGDWYHAGYHLATTIATPAAYAPLPWAFAMLTWPGGIIAFVIGVAVTWYNSFLLASLHEYGGVRQTRYKDLSGAILGKCGASCPPQQLVTGVQLHVPADWMLSTGLRLPATLSTKC